MRSAAILNVSMRFRVHFCINTHLLKYASSQSSKFKYRPHPRQHSELLVLLFGRVLIATELPIWQIIETMMIPHTIENCKINPCHFQSLFFLIQVQDSSSSQGFLCWLAKYLVCLSHHRITLQFLPPCRVYAFRKPIQRITTHAIQILQTASSLPSLRKKTHAPSSGSRRNSKAS